jgi:acetyl-CoA carboxylase carboxyl transferase subunit alpha
MKSADIGAVLTGAQLLLSMVETRRATRNGNGDDSPAALELEKIEQQLGQLESLDGQGDDIRKEIDDLRQRVHALRGAMVCGIARFHGEEVLLVGTQKGRDTKQKVYRNFGLPNPEGYRKALRAMKIAEKFGRPILTFIDVTGANPGLGAEERGQAEAIAINLREMARMRVPILTIITGEGGSGGALAIAVSNRILMMENAIYSVISPEGCASIMWRDASKKELAAEALRITAPDLKELGCIDEIVPEPPGGAHTDHDGAAKLVDEALQKNLSELKSMSADALIAARYEKFRAMARFFTEG